MDGGAALADRAFAPSSHPYSVAQNRKDATFKNIFIYTLTLFLIKRFIMHVFAVNFYLVVLLSPMKITPAAWA